MKNLKISVKLILYFVLVGFSTTVFVGYFSYNRAKVSLIERASDQLISLSQIKKTQIESFFSERMSDA
ncbi:MAG: hypothetical protein MI922_15485, partial [Bacteroidales bacterium]|nr:hypothetical protein [Bacteroidales bacterium]